MEQKHDGVGPGSSWGLSDASGLTSEERARCLTTGIHPNRWAWLKTCPRNTVIPRSMQGRHELLFNMLKAGKVGAK